MVSVIIPIFNEEKTLPELHRRLTATLQPLGRAFEILFIDDGSTSPRLPRPIRQPPF